MWLFKGHKLYEQLAAAFESAKSSNIEGAAAPSARRPHALPDFCREISSEKASPYVIASGLARANTD
jgi:hypothetical protein